MAIRVFIYEDNNARRESLKTLIDLTPGLEYVGDATDCRQVLSEMKTHHPEVVLMDINMPYVDGMAGLKVIKEFFPEVRVLIQTVFEDHDKIFESIRNGANGYILKKDPPQRIIQAIEETATNGAVMNPSIAQKVLEYFAPLKTNHGLTNRESEVLKLLADGLSYKMIAAQLNVSFNTVNSHIKNIYEKLHISSLGEAIAFYYKNLYRT